MDMDRDRDMDRDMDRDRVENQDGTRTGERGVLVAFRVMKGSSHALTNQFCKKFYGQDTSSHGGKYRYRRPGFLDDIPHHRLIRGVLVLSERDADRVVEFLGEYNAEIHVRSVALTESDLEALSEQGTGNEPNTNQ
jgi:hypothetical protein